MEMSNINISATNSSINKGIKGSKVLKVRWSLSQGYFIIEPQDEHSNKILAINMSYYNNENEKQSTLKIRNARELIDSMDQFLSKLTVSKEDYHDSYQTLNFVKESLLNEYIYYETTANFIEQQNSNVKTFFELKPDDTTEDFDYSNEFYLLKDILAKLRDLSRFVYGLSPLTIKEDEVYDLIIHLKDSLNSHVLKGDIHAINPYEIKEILSRYKKTFTLNEIGLWAMELEKCMSKNIRCN